MHLTDGDQIRNLLGRYCHLVDAGDFAGVGELLARATLCGEHGTPLARGSAEIAAFYERLVLRYDGRPGTQHAVANTVLEPAGDGARATSTYVVLQAVEGLPLQPIITGTYRDTFARDETGWHFTERRFAAGLSGRLDRHMAGRAGGS
ncbi:nuclear transport factor 2 family protein [Nocardioides sp. GY 10113]|uniref:nuclear transport factor 2 family protein n=1 Tax=Nocardioides sp. GY 10113 TaxID=2569761 RepID=UPI0010A8E6DD|nr:nuclear transport factor 2 family protein [Nocardioides sp. GY 10113]TIC84884.1 nuclear transport factor 2 family protein [Nocardioides sp. GY 10113]